MRFIIYDPLNKQRKVGFFGERNKTALIFDETSVLQYLNDMLREVKKKEFMYVDETREY